jgi:hypothetical protein
MAVLDNRPGLRCGRGAVTVHILVIRVDLGGSPHDSDAILVSVNDRRIAISAGEGVDAGDTSLCLKIIAKRRILAFGAGEIQARIND